MRHAANHERTIIAYVTRGLLRIDADGQIWRIAEMSSRTHSVYAVAPRRAEYVNKKGYLKIQVNFQGRATKCFAHRLVWQFFYGDIPADVEVNHKDLDKSNNRPLNLELVEHIENMQHAVRTKRALDRKFLAEMAT